jgi:hypothetical protein
MTAWADNPQAAQIDALIARAEQLTPVECDRLAAAAVRDRLATAGFVAGAQDAVAAWDAAGVAAGVAARDAARFGAGVAAGAAVRDAARDAARKAAWEVSIAAVALVVRDLIEEGTPWNQAAYDCLTGPWRRVIGPIHPDDEVLV